MFFFLERMNYRSAKKLNGVYKLLFKRPYSSSYAPPVDTRKRFSDKKFFKSNPRDGVVDQLCRDNKFREAIDVLCEQKRLREAVQLLDRIQQLSASTYSSLIRFCCHIRALEEGRKVHEHIKSSGFIPGVVICNRLLDMYAKCESLVDARKLFDEMSSRDFRSWNIVIAGYARVGLLEEARKLFDEMPKRDSFSWTAIISGYAKNDQPEEALVLFSLMQRAPNSKPDIFIVSCAVAAAAALLCIRRGKEIHGHIVRSVLDSDEVVWSALMALYGKCGNIDKARNIFDKMVDRDVVSWTAMIDLYFKDGRPQEAFTLFTDLIHSLVRPDEYTFSTVLKACADLTSEELGKQVHGYMTRTGFYPHSSSSNSLVHMYTKCSNIESAKWVFVGCPKPDVASWNSLIGGYAQHGQPEEALKHFELLLKSGTKPDHITFVDVLSACAHAGLVDKGLEYFYSMTEKHGLSHTAYHYGCVVDLLARSGRLKEAKDIISTMPMKPSRVLWTSLLGGCRIHGNVDLAEEAAQELFKIEPENPGTYVTMSNIYATASKWDEAQRLRTKMSHRGVIKSPGYSWTEIKRKVYVFSVGDTSHPRYNEIIEYLCELWKRMKEEGYVPDTNSILHDLEDEQKEQSLVYHSEKLAVAFAIISTEAGTPVKVFKNLRTCIDCHTAIKFISKIAGRKIIVRDSNRFHCFENGCCSCGDYW